MELTQRPIKEGILKEHMPLLGKENKRYWKLYIALFCLSVLLRIIHNNYILKIPLYYFPLGGNLPYIIAAEKIAGGDLFPFNTPFSFNSPFYSYILALEYSIFGIGNLFMARMSGIIVDSLTCVMVAILARRHFGKIAGIASGTIIAFYGPMIFYSAELAVVPYTLFFVTLGILLLDSDKAYWHYFISGLVFGLAVWTRPNLLILALMIIWIPFLFKRENKFLKTLLTGTTIILAILPLTITNYVASGRFILLTTSAGHNFYIGHNPASNAGYSLPESLDGDIFSNMKALAEKKEGRSFEDTEVSSYYFIKAFNHIKKYPVKELRNTGRKVLASVNDFEATTYANYYFQKEFSPVLLYSISFGILFPIAALGMVVYYRHYILLMPVAASFIIIVLFFYIARLRMPMVPFLAIFAGGAISTIFKYINEHRITKILLASFLIAGIGFFSNIELTRIDTSNEWNKVGVILRVQKKYDEAEKAFFRAMKENITNPNTYLNLGVLYSQCGQPELAEKMLATGLKIKNTAENYEIFESSIKI